MKRDLRHCHTLLALTLLRQPSQMARGKDYDIIPRELGAEIRPDIKVSLIVRDQHRVLLRQSPMRDAHSDHYKAEMIYYYVTRECHKWQAPGVMDGGPAASFASLSSLLWYCFTAYHGEDVVSNTPLYDFMSTARVNHDEINPRKWVYGPPQMVTTDYHVWVVELTAQELDDTFAILCTTKNAPAVEYDELVLVPIEQTIYGTAWTMVTLVGPDHPTERKWVPRATWLLVAIDKNTSVIVSFLKNTASLTGSVWLPLPDGTWTVFYVLLTELYRAWHSRTRLPGPDRIKMDPRPTMGEGSICIYTANPMENLVTTWYRLNPTIPEDLPRFDDEKHPMTYVWRAFHPELYFSYRMLTSREVDAFKLEQGAGYYVEILHYSEPQFDERPLVTPSIRDHTPAPEF